MSAAPAPVAPQTAPFPWMGGKRRIAPKVWERLGPVANYVEPFAGSLAVLLGRPHEPRIETVNDLDCNLANFWRACQAVPAEVAEWADWPVNEADLHARHRWLVGAREDWAAQVAEFRRKMKEDPDFYDAKRAGWWLWGICQWIGSGWCSAPSAKMPDPKSSRGIHSEPHRKRPVLAQRGGRGIFREQLPDLAGDDGAAGKGIHASGRMRVSEQIPHLGGGGSGMGIHRPSVSIYETMAALSVRLRRVRVCCGDWSRVMGPSVTHLIGLTGVFFDPPYSDAAGRDVDLYAEESLTVAHDVRAWCLENGGNPLLRIALCGYAGEHEELEVKGWSVLAWKAQGGYGNQGEDNANRIKERVWFSPHCIPTTRMVQAALL